MRGSQSDPTHTYAPVCPCLRLHYARVDAGGRVRVRLRAITTLLAGWQGLARRMCGADTTNDLTGLEGGKAGGLYAGLGAGF